MYASNIKQGEKYKILPKVITINLLNFNYYNEDWYHLYFRPVSDMDPNLIMNELEVHFIQLPAFKKKYAKNFKTDDLERWLAFLTETINDEEMEEILSMDKEILKAYEEIKHLLSDDEIIAIAEAKEKQRLDYNSAIDGAKEEGKTEVIGLGIELGKLEIINAFLDIADDETISLKTGIAIEVIKELRNQQKQKM